MIVIPKHRFLVIGQEINMSKKLCYYLFSTNTYYRAKYEDLTSSSLRGKVSKKIQINIHICLI